jgi:hypothetical protein
MNVLANQIVESASRDFGFAKRMAFLISLQAENALPQPLLGNLNLISYFAWKDAIFQSE